MKHLMSQQSSGKSKIKSLETRVANLEMAVRVSQLLIQKLLENTTNFNKDMGKMFQLINELQYKTLGIQNLLNLDVNQLSQEANNMRLKDFEEASDKEDIEKGFIKTDVIEEDSIVILTSIAKDEKGEDKGIFRSKIPLKEIGSSDVTSLFIGKRVGDKVVTVLNGLSHEIEILGIRKPSKKEQVCASLDSTAVQNVQ